MKTHTFFTIEELQILQKYFRVPFDREMEETVATQLRDCGIEKLIRITEKINHEKYKDLLFDKFNNFKVSQIAESEEQIKIWESNIQSEKEKIKEHEKIKLIIKNSKDLGELITNIYLINN